MEKIVLRCSSIDTFSNCSWQWYQVFILGKRAIPTARSIIGSIIHKAAEILWTEAIATGIKDTNKTKYKDLVIEEWQEKQKQEINYADEKPSELEHILLKGTESYLDDIVPFVEIPSHVELTLVKPIQHPIVKAISGTIDYIKDNEVIADIKTGKRKATLANYVTQQSLYKYLADEYKYKVKHLHIHNVILKTKPVGEIMPIEPNIPRAKYVVNNLLKVLRVYAEDKVHPEVLFRGNPRYVYCHEKFCNFYKECPFVQGKLD